MVRTAVLGLLVVLCAPVAADETPAPAVLGELAKVSAHAPWVRTVDTSHDGRWIVTGGPDRLATVWDAKSNEKHASLTLPRGKG